MAVEPLSSSCVILRMKPSKKDAGHYRAEAEKCLKAAVVAKDSATRLYWEQAARCWLTMANQAEVVVDLLRNQPTRLQNGQWQ
jgi:hypothetical protein